MSWGRERFRVTKSGKYATTSFSLGSVQTLHFNLVELDSVEFETTDVRRLNRFELVLQFLLVLWHYLRQKCGGDSNIGGHTMLKMN